MNKYIMDSGDEEILKEGSKAYNLAKMKNSSINVPDFFCITHECMEYHLKDSADLIEKIIKNVDFKDGKSIEAVSQSIKEIFRIVELDEKIKEEIDIYLEKNFKEVSLFSVRSSSLVEDSKEFSFAGQFDTYLNVSREDLFQNIVKCWSSLYSQNVLKYNYHKSISFSSLKMSVIIQEMIDADLSGVVFTANPQGILNEMVLVCGKGTGNQVVEDKVETTTYYYNITDNLYYYENQLKSPILKESIFESIIKVSDKLTSIFEKYIDIEFSIKHDKLYILQVRPITTLGDKDVTILDNSNIVESYPNITLPLTDSFVSEAYYRVFKALAMRCFPKRALVEKYDTVLREMVHSANGRMYYKISNWYTVLKFLPFRKKIIPIWQEMMGVNNKEHEKKGNDITFLQKIKIYLNAIHEAFNVTKEMDRLNLNFLQVKRYFNEEYKEDLSNEELVDLYDSVAKILLKNWDITLLNDIYAFVFTGLLKAELEKLKLKNLEFETNKYISGISNIESLKPIKSLIELSIYVSSDDKLIGELSELNSNDMVCKYLKNTSSDFVEKFEGYIDAYGDRALEELKLESKTFRTSPILLVDKILEYTRDKDRLEDRYQTLCNKSESFISKEMFDKCGFVDKKLIKLFSSKALIGIKNRESSRLNRSRVYGMVRSIFLAIGNNLFKDRKIDHIEDIFYLYTDEVFEYIKGKEYDFKKLVEYRKKEYKMYEELPAYSRLIFSEEIFNKNHLNINSTPIREDKSGIGGIPCSNGVVEGEIIVIENPKMSRDVKDKIIVTKMTDPGWVFLLTLAKGIITEKGSLLSHTAIISRELNIPAIVGVNKVTSIFKSGDMIRMDGSTGKIERVSDEACTK